MEVLEQYELLKTLAPADRRKVRCRKSSWQVTERHCHNSIEMSSRIAHLKGWANEGTFGDESERTKASESIRAGQAQGADAAGSRGWIRLPSRALHQLIESRLAAERVESRVGFQKGDIR